MDGRGLRNMLRQDGETSDQLLSAGGKHCAGVGTRCASNSMCCRERTEIIG